MYKVGELVRWLNPLDADYSYGTIVSIKGSIATVLGSGYYVGVITDIPLRYIEKPKKGGQGCGSSKKYSK